MDIAAPIHEGQVLTGSLFSEPMRVETVRSNGADTRVVGLSEQFRRVDADPNASPGTTQM